MREHREMSSENAPAKQSKKLTLTLSWKLLSIVLVILLAGLTFYTKPWEKITSNGNRTIDIKGEASIKKKPDQFVFNPSYDADSQDEINSKTTEVVNAVKALGLGDAGIQTQVSNYPNYKDSGLDGTYTYNLYLTLTVDDLEVAQKIQDYLATSGATGSITPMSGFTKDTTKQLKDQATEMAVQDAKDRAELMAKNLGTKLGKVISINEPDNYDVYPIASYDSSVYAEGSVALPINAGETEYSYTVTVKFEIK